MHRKGSIRPRLVVLAARERSHVLLAHLLLTAMSDTCVAEHDWFAAFLSIGLTLGLLLSYIPQHFRIINKNSSEGFSPWYLLLGSTSSASGMLNMCATLHLYVCFKS
jgi:hypothetical protein